jgi:uncharacterized protein with NAD-binding domain and iron-sulfur cluster
MTAKRVIIVGGGVAGMSVAHELRERSGDHVEFDIHVYEKRADFVGGKARSTPVLTDPGTQGGEAHEVAAWQSDGRDALPGEHGFRFFPRFYRHLPATMAQIPYGLDRHVVDNLVAAHTLQLARFDQKYIFVPTGVPQSLEQFIEDLRDLFIDRNPQLGLEPAELEFFAERMWQLLTSCDARRLAEYEKVTWWDFLKAEQFSHAYQSLLANGLSRSLLANDPQRASARTVGDTNIQLFFDMVEPGGSVDRLLNGPTSIVWLQPWRTYLENADGRLPGVSFHKDAEAVALLCESGRISGVKVRQNGQEQVVTGDVYVACLPVERMADLLERSGPAPLALDPGLEGILKLKSAVGRMNGMQFFLRKDVKIVDGHSLYVDSPWSLTSVSEMQFWSNAVDIARCDDGQVRGILSVCISDWDAPGLQGAPPAKDAPSRATIMEQVWAQLKKSLNVDGQTLLEDADLHSWYLDEDVADDPQARKEHYTDREPLFVNETDTWRLRPEAVTQIPNLFLASDYIRTYTDVACMEAANEAARRAVNGILAAAGSKAAPCRLWPLHEPDVFKPFRRADERRFQAGLPWTGELGAVEPAAQLPSARFVERSGMQCHLQPFACDDIALYGFFIEGSIDHLQALVDCSINEPAGGGVDYRVVSDRVLVTFAYVARGTSTLEPDKSMGYIPETSCTLWLVTAAYERGEARRIALFVPYIVVDNPWSMAAGREVYGFPKELGTFEMPKTVAEATRFSVRTTVLPTFGPEVEASQQPLLEIERSQSHVPKLERAIHLVEDGIGTLLRTWGLGIGNDLLSSLLDDAVNKEVPAVFLKQFRDAADGRRACYQAIIETKVKVTGLEQAGFLDGGYRCRVHDYASHPVKSDLGLADSTVPTTLPFHLKFSFEAGTGREVWRSQRRKIAILGGGVGAMTAAYELTEVPGWQDKYDITVYQMGWRLGGKGASGRNRARHQRIEEHGLHLWFGYYDNAFNLMQRCYKALNRPHGAPLATWDQAFRPHGEVVIGERHDGHWSTWSIPLPEDLGGPPGDGALPSLCQCLERLLGAVIHTFERSWPEHLDKAPRRGLAEAPQRESLWDRLEGVAWEGLELAADGVEDLAGRLLGREGDRVHPELAPLEIARALLRAYESADQPGGELGRLLQLLESRFDSLLDGILQHTLKAVEAFVDPFLQKIIQIIEDADKGFEHVGVDLADLRRLGEVLDLALVNFRGIVADDVIEKGFDHLNELDYREWMKKHGATGLALNADTIRVAYETIFAFEDGDTERPNLAAGVALYGLMRLCFGWKGSPMWKMEAGMGDTVFAPLYLVLKSRGVSFKFFHKVEHLGLSADRQQVETIAVAEQVKLKVKEYQPLRTVKQLPCWPSEPLYEQIVDGEKLEARRVNLESAWADWPSHDKLILRRGIDFDEVILGISLGGLPAVCQELIQASPAWRDMVDKVPTVQTQAFQVWTTRSLEELGWPIPDGDPTRTPVLGGYAQPQNTWADMSHLIPREDWPEDQQPGSIAYFCGPMEGPPAAPPAAERDFPKREATRVKDFATQWLRDNATFLWPRSVRSGALNDGGFLESFDWQDLADLGSPATIGPARFERQFWRANVDPSERYVLSTKGSIKHRLKSDRSGFDNLFLAGDWTLNGLNIGCVEAAVVSGLEAARAITGDQRAPVLPLQPAPAAKTAPT